MKRQPMNKEKEIEQIIRKNQITEEIENNCKRDCPNWISCIKEVNECYESGQAIEAVSRAYDCRLAVDA